jgi:hypothetical protein
MTLISSKHFRYPKFLQHIQIIYDSLLVPYSVSFGSGIRRSLNEDYRQAQERDGVITSLEPRSLEDARRPSAPAIEKCSRPSAKILPLPA